MDRIFTTIHQPVSVAVTVLVVLYWRQILTSKGGKSSNFLSGWCSQITFYGVFGITTVLDLYAGYAHGTYNQGGFNLPYYLTSKKKCLHIDNYSF
jgi:hypothetical protein